MWRRIAVFAVCVAIVLAYTYPNYFPVISTHADEQSPYYWVAYYVVVCTAAVFHRVFQPYVDHNRLVRIVHTLCVFIVIATIAKIDLIAWLCLLVCALVITPE